MSTLTKILIVLLTLSSIFLCGIVVTYVANAANYKEEYSEQKARFDLTRQNERSLKKQLKEESDENQQLEDKLVNETASLKAQIGELQSKLNDAEREKSLLLQKVDSWTSITRAFYATNDEQGQLLKNALGELNRVQAEQVGERRKLNETTAALVERMAIIETLQAETKRLREQRSELQSRLDQLLQPFGEVAAAPVPVTPTRAVARPSTVTTEAFTLSGVVTTVDLKNSMAGISIGSADGVKKGMKLYATRGDEFVCEILIIEVDSEEAVGILELVQRQLKVGDNVSTNL